MEADHKYSYEVVVALREFWSITTHQQRVSRQGLSANRQAIVLTQQQRKPFISVGLRSA